MSKFAKLARKTGTRFIDEMIWVQKNYVWMKLFVLVTKGDSKEQESWTVYSSVSGEVILTYRPSSRKWSIRKGEKSTAKNTCHMMFIAKGIAEKMNDRKET